MMKLLYTLAFCWLIILTGCDQGIEPVIVKHRLIYNNDGTEILGNNWFGKRPLTLSDVNQYVD